MSQEIVFDQITCSDGRFIGSVMLDNSASLNALTYSMLEQLEKQLLAWQQDDAIRAVVLHSDHDKAFCAGGDVRAMFQIMDTSTEAEIKQQFTDYFTLEYRCDYLLHNYAKPVIAWGHGIVMGGGMGLYMAASHRIVTESSRLAMPEISIGLYPDVGGTYFLNRLPFHQGLFLGLTGAMVNSQDALALGWANHCVSNASKANFINALTQLDWDDDKSDELISDLIRDLSSQQTLDLPHRQLAIVDCEIKRACEKDSLPQIVDAILAIDSRENKWLQHAQQNLAEGSPITAHICYRQMTQCRTMGLADAFRQELSLSVHCGLLGEFSEGVRARLIDKTGQPNWQFASVADVKPDVIDEMFTSLWSEQEHPLVEQI